ncbi:general substrate transporter, partial [Martensiomyces pterosporus]
STTDSRRIGITQFQLFCCLVGALGSANFGWNIGVINIPGGVISQCTTGPKHFNGPFPSCIPTSDTVWGVAVGCYALGALAGALTGIPLSNTHGRKPVLIWASMFSVAGALFLSLSVNLAMFIIGRVLVGIAAGASNGTLAVYVSEITTPKARNILGGVLQMACAIGIMLSQTVSLGASRPPAWRALFAVTGLIGMLTFCLGQLCTESPRWLILRGKEDEAHCILQRLRKDADITAEFAEMVDAINCERSEGEHSAGIVDVVLGRTPNNLRHQLLVVVMVMLFQQLCGINAVVFYSTAIFDRTTNGDPASIPTLAQILAAVISVVAVVSTFIGMVLCTRFGRRTLMLTSHGAMAVFCLLVVVGNVRGVDRLVIATVFLYFVFFQIGVGPIPWTSAGELTPTYAAAAFNAIGTGVNYLFTFVIGVIFPPLQSGLGNYTFLFFMAFNVAAFVLCLFFLPETKDRQIADMV